MDSLRLKRFHSQSVKAAEDVIRLAHSMLYDGKPANPGILLRAEHPME